MKVEVPEPADEQEEMETAAEPDKILDHRHSLQASTGVPAEKLTYLTRALLPY